MVNNKTTRASEPTIKITDPQSLINVYDPIQQINSKFDFYIKIVIGILVIGMITMIFMTSTLIIDSFHINSAAYKDYSEKTETLNSLQETNKKQLELINENQKRQEELFKNRINK